VWMILWLDFREWGETSEIKRSRYQHASSIKAIILARKAKLRSWKGQFLKRNRDDREGISKERGRDNAT